MMPFPESGAYHGIASTGDFENLERRRLSSTAFIFNANRDSEDQTIEECSISWADSDEALYMLADQVKYDKKIEALRGFVWVDALAKMPTWQRRHSLRVCFPDRARGASEGAPPARRGG